MGEAHTSFCVAYAAVHPVGIVQETFLCVGMGFGGYIDDQRTFVLYWLLHLVGGGCYIVSTIIVPLARFSDDGEFHNTTRHTSVHTVCPRTRCATAPTHTQCNARKPCSEPSQRQP